MVLTHALCHMKNPESVQTINKLIFGFTDMFGTNLQPHP